MVIKALNDALFSNQTQLLQKIEQDANGLPVWVGEAYAGSSTSGSVWRIKQISTSGTMQTVAWASGSNSFAYVWDDRKTYTYS